MPMPTFRSLNHPDAELPVTRPEIVHTFAGPSGTFWCVHNGGELYWASDLAEAHSIRRRIAGDAWNQNRIVTRAS